MPTVKLANGKRFIAAAGESLLEAAIRAGIALEYSCKVGRCGACRAHILAGSTVSLAPELVLTESERNDGCILTCMRTALEDVEIDVADIEGIELTTPRLLPCRINALERMGTDVMKVTLRLPPSESLGHTAGQYVDVIGKAGVRRSYSIANAPRPDGTLELHIRRVEGGVMSRYWFEEAEKNDLLRLHGPLGTLVLRDATDEDLVFLATGTGLAPVKAILEDLATRSTERRPRVALFWGGREQADLYWTPESAGVEFVYVPVLSRADAVWSGARGYVQEALLRSGIDLTKATVYAYGSPSMIDAARQTLVCEGLDSRRFHSDAFVPSCDARSPHESGNLSGWTRHPPQRRNNISPKANG